ncbi:alkaline phosphatase family protein [Sphingomonas sp. ASV193]|uniref:alkaline phosphatase family protein n=1 Tax=Sphingomonas sp. ASV193 TaxID=3144405 RepID=UPI0032E91895
MVTLSGCATVGQRTAVSRPPKLVVAIAVDQFSADLFDEYQPRFTGGLARLARRGTLFHNGYQAHAATETCPGHSTILTGDHPAHTGIVANNFYDPAGKRWPAAVYCAEDEDRGTAANYVVSPRHLKVPVLGERMKRLWPESRSVAIAGKDRAAVMMGGHTPDIRWYYRDGRFQTDLDAKPDDDVMAANAKLKALVASHAPPLLVPADCLARAKGVATAPKGPTVGAGRFEHDPSEQLFRASPALDEAVLNLAGDEIDRDQLGRHASPDLLAISLSATDYVGHAFGTEGQEMCIQLHRLDAILGAFLDGLDRRGIDYALVLTADHGGTDIPERLSDGKRYGFPSGAIGEAIKAQLGLKANPLVGGGDVYLDPALDPATRDRVVALALAAYRADPNVAAVFTRAELAAYPIPTGDPVNWRLEDRARASFDAKVSGDLTVLLKRHVVPIPKPAVGYVATHGSAWDNDRRVPILFYRPRARAAERRDDIMTVDIMPTLAAWLGLPVEGAIDGHCVAGAAGAVCPGR